MTSVRVKYEEIKCAIEKVFAGKPDWVKFYREVMGPQGLIRRAFPTLEAMAEFERTDTYRMVHRMVTELRKPQPKSSQDAAKDKGNKTDEAEEPDEADEAHKIVEPVKQDEETRVVTIRIPKSMHIALQKEADEYHTSMNKLCISKLLHFIRKEHVPPKFEEEEEKKEAGL